MKMRYFFIALLFFALYSLVPKKTNHVPNKLIQPIVVHKNEPQKLSVLENYPEPKLNPNKVKVFDPPQQLSHEEFVAIEKKFAEKKLKELILGWCNASESEVQKFLVNNVFDTNHRRQEVLNPRGICLNKENKEWQCFTYQAYCPNQFQETNDVTLLQFWSGENVYRYERRVMDYQTYIENPENPPFPEPHYWITRANEIKILAERIRGEPIDSQNWGLKETIDKD